MPKVDTARTAQSRITQKSAVLYYTTVLKCGIVPHWKRLQERTQGGRRRLRTRIGALYDLRYPTGL
jgi:hypothetical protein